MAKFEIKGLDELNKNLSKLGKISKEALKEEIRDIAFDFASKSSNAAPVKYGDLRGSLAIPKKINDTSWEVGSNLPYTRRQHECTWYNHPLGGGPKFLERPFNENKDKYIKAVKKRLKDEINNVGR